jgi:hypothetical protein
MRRLGRRANGPAVCQLVRAVSPPFFQEGGKFATASLLDRESSSLREEGDMSRNFEASKLWLISLLLASYAQGVSAESAKVVSAKEGGVGFVTVSSTADGLSAQIGRWDTPYPNRGTGDVAPGLEPSGSSTLTIDIAVNDGGTVSFGYRFLTYDAGIYDWLDIAMITPDGTEYIVGNFGKPGADYGDYWESASIAITRSLDKWRGKHVTFVFSVEQDGWGDQSAARLSNFAIRACGTPALTAITDDDALSFENGNTINTEKLNAGMKTALACLQQSAAARGGSLTVTSAYRPLAYQIHLREVWDRWSDLRNSRDPDCDMLRSQVETEFKKHGLQLTQRPATTSAHTRGEAFDARWTLPPGTLIDTISVGCDLKRPFIDKDPVHFIHR